MSANWNDQPVSTLEQPLGSRFKQAVALARYTAARIGGPADYLIEVRTVNELVEAVQLCWRHAYPLTILGGGTNVLVSDRGVRGCVIINRARRVHFDPHSEPPTVWAEAGTNFGSLARQAAQHGLAGLEWAAGIPGTLGGAIVGNAGAHGGDMAGNLLVAEILQRITYADAAEPYLRAEWTVERMKYSYRSSILKDTVDGSTISQPERPWAVVLAARLKLTQGQPAVIQARMEELAAYRHRTQPPGASLGSIFKNPPGDYAGRLIDAAGLKGARFGNAEISPLHANFFINHGEASATDYYRLICLARQKVAEKFGVKLELEVKLLGDWNADAE